MTDPTSSAQSLEAYWPFADPFERAPFASSVYVLSGDECWIWLGGIESDGGYGHFRSETLGVIATHRWSALARYGARSEPVVQHRCDVGCCVRPDHLVVGTQAQNVADTGRRGRWTSHARTGRRQWPALAYALRTAARARDDEQIAELLRRPIQLALWPEPSGHPAADACSPVAVAVSS